MPKIVKIMRKDGSSYVTSDLTKFINVSDLKTLKNGQIIYRKCLICGKDRFSGDDWSNFLQLTKSSPFMKSKTFCQGKQCKKILKKHINKNIHSVIYLQ